MSTLLFWGALVLKYLHIKQHQNAVKKHIVLKIVFLIDLKKIFLDNIGYFWAEIPKPHQTFFSPFLPSKLFCFDGMFECCTVINM